MLNQPTSPPYPPGLWTAQTHSDNAYRANALVVITMVSKCLAPEKQQALLLASYSAALRDPFPHCRVLGVKGLAEAAGRGTFGPEAVATKVRRWAVGASAAPVQASCVRAEGTRKALARCGGAGSCCRCAARCGYSV